MRIEADYLIETPFELAQGSAVDRLTVGATVLTDDYAPVDQLLNPYGQR